MTTWSDDSDFNENVRRQTIPITMETSKANLITKCLESISPANPTFNHEQLEDWDDEEDGEWTLPTIINKFF
ncbi:hypothetical protein L1887_22992 [Cichorium endivia]|nr:hypothetical protein L1887_22992 [Cichorium endivia]